MRAIDIEAEETVLAAEAKMAELRGVRDGRSLRTAMALERLTHALRLALVAEIEPRLLARLHLRLEETLRSVEQLEPGEEPPPSQRPTLPPGPGDGPMELWERAKPNSERATMPPPASSGRGRTVSDVIPRVGVDEEDDVPMSARAS